ncbi:hypothetical protein D083_1285 [Dickeya solani RNS 08.23.3.1.A]|nr:hypothetical protein D083_1285 [Dickeya solani RNS 08.23.3.1.A]
MLITGFRAAWVVALLFAIQDMPGCYFYSRNMMGYEPKHGSGSYFNT